jgi:nucleotide-binding universal stress UspA family protein
MSELAFRRVLCPVDLSEYSSAALRYGDLIARATGAGLELLHAFFMEVPPYVTRENHPELLLQISQARNDALSAVAALAAGVLGPDARPAIHIADSAPVDAIVERVRAFPDTLIVMGSHGRSGFRRLLLGSVTERVMREAGCPILVAKTATLPADLAIRKIMCPVNRSVAGRAALTAAMDLARRLDAQLEVVHVRETAAAGSPADLCRWVGVGPEPGCRLTETTLDGDAAEQLVKWSSRSGADLLVVGSEHKPFHDVSVLGTTTVRLVRHAQCPILVIPAIAASEAN